MDGEVQRSDRSGSQIGKACEAHGGQKLTPVQVRGEKGPLLHCPQFPRSETLFAHFPSLQVRRSVKLVIITFATILDQGSHHLAARLPPQKVKHAAPTYETSWHLQLVSTSSTSIPNRYPISRDFSLTFQSDQVKAGLVSQSNSRARSNGYDHIPHSYPPVRCEIVSTRGSEANLDAHSRFFGRSPPSVVLGFRLGRPLTD